MPWVSGVKPGMGLQARNAFLQAVRW